MSSFFTVPASQKKRKRNEGAGPTPTRRTRDTPTRPSVGDREEKAKRLRKDESISGSDSSDVERALPESDGELSSSDSDEDETGAERRLKLAERYLENVKGDVEEQIGFDAEDLDRDLIAERLKEDVAETKGRLHRYIASDYDYASAAKVSFRQETHCMTSISTCPPYAYTVSSDIQLTKWELPTPSPPRTTPPKKSDKGRDQPRRRPTKLLSTRGDRKKASDKTYRNHTGPILCVAASSDGQFVVTGGEDKRLIIWSAADLQPLRVFFQHRDAITSLAFRRGTNQLYSASADRTIKTWSLNELAYVETLFGHQDCVVDVAALSQERCLSAGARDRSVRLWKVVEETQLVFRGGGSGEKKSKGSKAGRGTGYAEGSIDRVALVDDETFITGSDNGSLCLWDVHKKKSVFTLVRAHGLDPALTPEEAFAETELEGREVPAPPEPRWITALRVVPYSDLVVSGSWDGDIRIWRVTQDRKRIEAVAIVGRVGQVEEDTATTNGLTNGTANGAINGDTAPHVEGEKILRGVINDLDVFERGEKGRDGLCIVAAVGKHHRLGKWKKIDGRNGAVVFEIPRKALQ